MLQKEDNILINSLLKELERRQISIPDFAKQVNLPVARVYKWKQRGGGIKGDDALTVSNWLKVVVKFHGKKTGSLIWRLGSQS